MLVIAGSTSKELARQVSYLKAENQILRSRLPERLILTHREKNRLVRFAKNLGSALNELATIVHPSTIRRWIRDASDKVAKTRKNVGRPRPAEQIEKLILKLAKDNSWGYQFVEDVVKYCQTKKKQFATEGVEVFLLRNRSRGHVLRRCRVLR